MKKEYIKPEQRPWSYPTQLAPPTRTKDGYCKKCDKKLSIFNLGKYCFIHQVNSDIEKQNKMQEEARMRTKTYKKRINNEKFKKKLSSIKSLLSQTRKQYAVSIKEKANRSKSK